MEGSAPDEEKQGMQRYLNDDESCKVLKINVEGGV